MVINRGNSCQSNETHFMLLRYSYLYLETSFISLVVNFRLFYSFPAIKKSNLPVPLKHKNILQKLWLSKKRNDVIRKSTVNILIITVVAMKVFPKYSTNSFAYTNQFI